jgi:hypothetical protein
MGQPGQKSCTVGQFKAIIRTKKGLFYPLFSPAGRQQAPKIPDDIPLQIKLCPPAEAGGFFACGKPCAKIVEKNIC